MSEQNTQQASESSQGPNTTQGQPSDINALLQQDRQQRTTPKDHQTESEPGYKEKLLEMEEKLSRFETQQKEAEQVREREEAFQSFSREVTAEEFPVLHAFGDDYLRVVSDKAIEATDLSAKEVAQANEDYLRDIVLNAAPHLKKEILEKLGTDTQEQSTIEPRVKPSETGVGLNFDGVRARRLSR